MYVLPLVSKHSRAQVAKAHVIWLLLEWAGRNAACC
jgi:hypothetical protein